MSVEKKPHILIAGAGLGGLTLAQCLRARNHPFTIFERDGSAHARSQGWALSLHTMLADLMTSVPDDMPSIEPVSHLMPLENAKPQLTFYDCRTDGKPSMKFFVESKPKKEVGYGEGRIIRANRDRLRDWLSTNINVEWGKQIASFQQDVNGVTVKFKDGSSAQGDILVGADGVRSVIRDGLIPNAPLQNVPSCAIIGEVKLSKEDYEKQMRIGNSAYVVLGRDHMIFVGLKQIADDASSADYYWYLIWEDQARAGSHWIDTASAKELYDYAIQHTQTMDPKLVEIIRKSSPEGIQTPPLIFRDLTLEQMPVTRVTLLGDAAHAMTPFRGEGGCHAIEDAIKLAKTLTTGGDLGEYQTEMLQRGSAAVKASRAAGSQGDQAETDVRKAWGQTVQVAPVEY